MPLCVISLSGIDNGRCIPLDAEIVAKAIAGDKDSFAVIVDETYKSVFGLAMSKVLNVQIAEDIVQEAYLKAYSKLNGLRKPEKFLPWLRQIVANEAVSYLRSRNTCINNWGSGDEVGDIPGDVPKEPNTVIDLSGPIADAIRRLPLSSREAIVLVRLLGLSPSDAAGVLGISRSAVDVRLNRAMNALRKELSLHMDETMEEMLDESRAYCVRIAGQISEQLEAKEPRMIRYIARELRILATRANIPQLAKDLQSPVAGRVSEAAKIARETGDPRLLPYLCRAIEVCGDPTTLINLVKAVEAIRDPGGLEPLRALIRRTAYVNVISAAREAVEALKDLEGAELKDIPVSSEDLTAAGLDRILMELAGNPDREVAANALEGLGRLGCLKAVPLALKAFNRSDPVVKLAAAHCLGYLGHRTEEVVVCLRSGLYDQAEPVVMASAGALADLDDFASAPIMAERFASYRTNGPVPWVLGENMARLLGGPCGEEIRDRAIGIVVKYLTASDLLIRNCTCHILKKCAAPGQTSHNDDILEVLSLTDGYSGKPGALIPDKRPLYLALAISGDIRSIPGLERCLINSDRWGEEAAGNALAGLGSPGLASLKRLAADKSCSDDCRIAAIDALEAAASAGGEAMACLEDLHECLHGEKRFETRVLLALKRARRSDKEKESF